MRAVVRAVTIAGRTAAFLGCVFLHRLGVRSAQPPARRFAALLEDLGTPFVKLGQHLSLRHDLLPPDFVEALQDLQDHVRPFDPALAAAEIERALGAPPAVVFARFDREPFAAASIAQVHGARTHEGQEVIVKVRRPDIVARVELDMRLLLMVVRVLSWFAPVLRRYRAHDVVREVWQNLRRELDLREEARQVQRFAAAFERSATVMIPEVIDPLCRESVMVQRRSGGERVDRIADRERGRELARNFIDAYVRMFFSLGLFHGDPHPGNLFVMADGRLCFHDFGIVGTLDRPARQALAAFMLAFAEQDSEWILQSWSELGMLGATADREALRPTVAEIVADCAGRPLSEWSIGAAFTRLVASARGQDVRIPIDMLVLARTVLLMEKTVRMLDPEFSLLDALRLRSGEVVDVALSSERADGMRLRYETAIAANEWRRLLAGAVRQFRRRGFALQVEHEGLRELGKTHLKAANRVSVALVTLGLYLASSLLMQHSIGPDIGGYPMLAVMGYAAAVWFTVRLVRRIGSGL